MADIIENAAAGLERALMYSEGRECSLWYPHGYCQECVKFPKEN